MCCAMLLPNMQTLKLETEPAPIHGLNPPPMMVWPISTRGGGGGAQQGQDNRNIKLKICVLLSENMQLFPEALGMWSLHLLCPHTVPRN